MTGIPSETLERIGQSDTGPPPVGSPSSLSFLGSGPNWHTSLMGLGGNHAEIRVNEFTALNYQAFFTCVKLIANTISSLPFKVYNRRPDGGQDELPDHPAARILAREFNPNTSAITGRQAQIGHLLTWGNSYTQIVRRRNGELLRLQPLGPDLVTPDTDANGNLYYTVRDREQGTLATLSREEVLHIPFYTFDSLVGYSLVALNRGLIRQGLGQDRQAERFVTAGMRPPGALRFREGSKFKSEAEAIQFRERLRAIHAKSDGDQQIIILEDGAEWQSLGTDPEKSQLLESRRFTRDEMASVFQIPPVMIGGSANTYNGTGVEELNIWFATYCLMPILELIEQEYDRKLFADDMTLFVKHELKGLLRGDALKRAQALKVQMDAGIITVNEWREMENMNPVEGGDVRYAPLNMARIDSNGEDILPPERPPASLPATPSPATPPSQQQSAEWVKSVLADLRKKLAQDIGRALRKEAAEAIKAAKKPAEFVTWIETFYDRHAEQVREVYDTQATAGWAERHLAESRAQLLAAAECQPAELVDRVTRAVEKWPTDRLAQITGEISHAA
jgi:HK97 family phage portal protein